MPNIRDVGRDLNVSLSSIPVSKWTRASSAPAGDDSGKGSKKTSFGVKIPATVDERRLASPKSDKGKADISAFQDEIDRLDDGLSGDQDKLALAAKLVNDQIGDESTLGDTAYRNAVQATYDDMNPSLGYVTISGDWGDPVRQLNDAINDVNYGIGSGLDWLWDNTVAAGLGGLADFTGLGDGEAVKEQVADFMTPEGGSIAADMLIDLGLGLIPGVGPWLAVGKGLVQNSENIYEGLTGRDDITGERLDPGQQFAKALLGVGGTALDVIPGIGNARAAGKVASEAIGKADDVAASAAKVMNNLSDVSKEGLKSSGLLDPVSRGANRAARQATEEGMRSMKPSLGDTAIGRVIDRAITPATGAQAPLDPNSALGKVTKRLNPKFYDEAVNAGKDAGKAAGKATAGGGAPKMLTGAVEDFTPEELDDAIEALTAYDAELAKTYEFPTQVTASPSQREAARGAAEDLGRERRYVQNVRRGLDDDPNVVAKKEVLGGLDRRDSQIANNIDRVSRIADSHIPGESSQAALEAIIMDPKASKKTRDRAMDILLGGSERQDDLDKLIAASGITDKRKAIAGDIDKNREARKAIDENAIAQRANRPIAFVDNLRTGVKNYPSDTRERFKENWDRFKGGASRIAAGKAQKFEPLKGVADMAGGVKGMATSWLPTPRYMRDAAGFDPEANFFGTPSDTAKFGRKWSGRNSPTMRLLFPSGIRNNLLAAATPVVTGVVSEQAEHGGSLTDAAGRYGDRLASGGLVPAMIGSYFVPGMVGGRRLSRSLRSPGGSVGMFDAPSAAARAAANIHFYNAYPTGSEDEWELTPEDYARMLNERI